MRIGVDLMGSDSSPHLLFEAVLQVARELTSSDLLLVLVHDRVKIELKERFEAFLNQEGGQIEFVSVSETIKMDESPLHAVRRKKNSSVVVGMQLLAMKKIEALVSAGNTGALMLSALIFLKTIPGLYRPALLANLPTKTGSVAVLDVGANIACLSSHLIQFAQIGATYQCCHQIQMPKVGLLNIGAEARKGTEAVRKTYQLLKKYSQEFDFQFVGNVEGREVFQGAVDVLVTDGFTGNVFLKTSEGVSTFVIDQVQKILKDNLPKSSSDLLEGLKRHLDYAEYPGAILCGVEGVVVKVHGASGAKAFAHGIQGAIDLIHRQLVDKIKSRPLFTPEEVCE